MLNSMNLRLRLTALISSLLLGVSLQANAANPTNFTVVSATSTNTFALTNASGKFVALHFLLKTECPYCLRYTRDYATRSASVTNVIHIFLKPDSETEIKEWATKLGEETAPLANVYRDPDATLAKAFGIPNGYKFHGQTVHFPALVLLDQNGREVFRYIGKSNADRLPYDQFAAKLRELTSPSPH